MNLQTGFAIDLNKCTGCHACAVACILENELPFDRSWRNIHSFNPEHLPGHAGYHLSLACNHCGDPPCMKYCPALAYQKDAKTGIVTLDPAKCIGCRYCSWVCPYDAPAFSEEEGIMTKCTFCTGRLAEGLQPACVTLCPTGALTMEAVDVSSSTPEIVGFPDQPIQPAVTLVPHQSGRSPADGEALPYPQSLIDRVVRSGQKNIRGLTVRSEWSLIAFGLLIAVWYAVTSSHLLFRNISPEWIWMIPAVAALTVSLFHLGKKSRAWRAVLNWRRSWLSREIIGYNLFLVLSVLSHHLIPHHPVLTGATVLMGTGLLMTIDQVYHKIPVYDRIRLHGGSVLLTSLALLSILSGEVLFFLPLAALRFYLYFSRKSRHRRWNTAAIWRCIAGFILPLPLMIFPGYNGILPAFLLGMIGDVIDRVEFYRELVIVSPQEEIRRVIGAEPHLVTRG